MEFANLTFLYLFLPAAVLVYYLLPGIGRKNTALLVFSLLFYAMGQPLYLPLLVLLGLVLHAPIAIFCFIMATESALKVPFGLHRIRGGKWIHDVTQDLNA